MRRRGHERLAQLRDVVSKGDLAILLQGEMKALTAEEREANVIIDIPPEHGLAVTADLHLIIKHNLYYYCQNSQQWQESHVTAFQSGLQFMQTGSVSLVVTASLIQLLACAFSYTLMTETDMNKILPETQKGLGLPFSLVVPALCNTSEILFFLYTQILHVYYLCLQLVKVHPTVTTNCIPPVQTDHWSYPRPFLLVKGQ